MQFTVYRKKSSKEGTSLILFAKMTNAPVQIVTLPENNHIIPQHTEMFFKSPN